MSSTSEITYRLDRHEQDVLAGSERGEHPPGDLRPIVEECLRRKSDSLYAQTTEAMERYVFARVLQETRGNQSRAAKLLGITRGCLRNKLRALHISCETRVILNGVADLLRSRGTSQSDGSECRPGADPNGEAMAPVG